MVKIRNEREQYYDIESFLKRTSEIEMKIKALSEEIKYMENIQRELYLNPFYNEEDVETMDVKKYEKACDQVLASSAEIHKNIGVLKIAMYRCAHEYPSSNDTESESHLKLKSTQLDFLARQLSDLLNEYRKSQSIYVDKTKARLKRQPTIVQTSQIGYDNFSFDDHDSDSPESPSAIFIGGYPAESKKVIAELQQLENREKELKELESDIVCMHRLFKEVNVMVTEQDETIDETVQIVNVTGEKVEVGVVHLKHAQHHQKSFLKRKTMLCVIILAVAVVLLVIITVSVIL